ncbi:DUF6042 family protein [Nonomuraea indica]|uniref:DUF6042 family protein n=1 Tax=Nonomuraea indica TaxID=1581193 RepID=UPI001183E1CD|nr:DUF6042 family protein [Nonomuraea indica]
MTDDERELKHWRAGFTAFAQACGHPAVETMADLLALWQDIGLLTANGATDDDPLWSLPVPLPSPWHVLYARGRTAPPHTLAAALDFLLDSATTWDREFSPREVFNLIVTPDVHGNRAVSVVY